MCEIMKIFLSIIITIECFNLKVSGANTQVKKFKSLVGKNLVASALMNDVLKTFKCSNVKLCLQSCTSATTCSLAIYDSTQRICTISSQTSLLEIDMLDSTSSTIFYVTDKTTVGLKWNNYWPFNNNYLDIKTGNSLITYYGGIYPVADRFDRSNMAIQINNAFMVDPTPKTLNADFTISTWIFPYRFLANDRVIDFTTDLQFRNYVFISLSYPGLPGCPFANMYDSNGAKGVEFVSTTKCLSLNQWNHLAMTVTNNKVQIYINGTESGPAVQQPFPANSATRLLNFLGKSNFGDSPSVQYYIDDLIIFGTSLGKSGVNYAMQISL